MSRIAAAEPPYAASVQQQLDRIMPAGQPPLLLFRVLARDERLFARFFGGGLLDRGHLSLRERELVILRVCARCDSEYEWGVHVATFAGKAGLCRAQLCATLQPGWEHDALSDAERWLFRLCDELLAGTQVSAQTLGCARYPAFR